MASIVAQMPVFYPVMNGWLRLGVGLVLLGLASSCAASSDRGRALFGERRFVEAAEVFEHGEAQLGQYENQDRACYGLYRGMTLLRLGDLDGSARWLAFAQSAETAHPGSLLPPELKALRQAHLELNEARSKVPSSPDPLGGAFAHSSTSSPDVTQPDTGPKDNRARSEDSAPTSPIP